MLRLIIITLFLLVFTIINSCYPQIKKSEQEYLSSAKTVLDSAVTNNYNNLYAKAIKIYKEFLNEYPGSNNAISTYVQIAEIYTDNLKYYYEAINTYNEIIDKFSTSKEAMNASFLIAFIYDNYIQDKQNAKLAYKQFLEKYPDSNDPSDIDKIEAAKLMLEALERNISVDSLIMEKVNNSKK